MNTTLELQWKEMALPEIEGSHHALRHHTKRLLSESFPAPNPLRQKKFARLKKQNVKMPRALLTPSCSLDHAFVPVSAAAFLVGRAIF